MCDVAKYNLFVSFYSAKISGNPITYEKNLKNKVSYFNRLVWYLGSLKNTLFVSEYGTTIIRIFELY